MSRILSVSFLTAALAACNPYNPNLGVEPFKCGDNEPRCPLDYTCVTYTGGEAICELTDRSGIPDSGPDDETGFDCNDDGDIEPNDVIGQAFESGIPDQDTSFLLVGLAICPANDIDFFKFEVAESGVNVEVDVTYEPSRGELVLDILNQSATSIATGEIIDGEPNVLHAQLSNLAAGAYYVQLRSVPGVTNNYDKIEIVTTE